MIIAISEFLAHSKKRISRRVKEIDTNAFISQSSAIGGFGERFCEKREVSCYIQICYCKL